MNAKRILLASIAIFVVSYAFMMLTCGWLFTWVYEFPPNIWLNPETMMSSANMVGSIITGGVKAFFFVLVFAVLYKGIPGEGIKKGLMYGFLTWLVGALVGMAGMPFYMTISVYVIIYWIIQALVLGLINGLLVGAIYKK